SVVDLGHSTRRGIGLLVLFQNGIPVRAPSGTSAHAHEQLVTPDRALGLERPTGCDSRQRSDPITRQPCPLRRSADMPRRWRMHFCDASTYGRSGQATYPAVFCKRATRRAVVIGGVADINGRMGLAARSSGQKPTATALTNRARSVRVPSSLRLTFVGPTGSHEDSVRSSRTVALHERFPSA